MFYILYANSCVGRGTEVLSIVKSPVIFEFIFYILYANSCAAVNLFYRLLEVQWDGGSFVNVGGWRRFSF